MKMMDTKQKQIVLSKAEELGCNQALVALKLYVGKLDMKAAAKERLMKRVAKAIRQDLANGAVGGAELFLEDLKRQKYIVGVVNRLASSKLKRGKSLESFSDIAMMMFVSKELNLLELEAVQEVCSQADARGLSLSDMVLRPTSVESRHFLEVSSILKFVAVRYRVGVNVLAKAVSKVVRAKGQ